jgi:hypothetical protein
MLTLLRSLLAITRAGWCAVLLRLIYLGITNTFTALRLVGAENYVRAGQEGSWWIRWATVPRGWVGQRDITGHGNEEEAQPGAGRAQARDC